MSFSITIPGLPTKVIKRGQQFLLVSRHNVYIEKLTAASISHDVYLNTDKLPVLIMPVRAAFLTEHLWIETSLIDDGLVSTHVFNMSDSRLMIKKGQVVSLLICL